MEHFPDFASGQEDQDAQSDKKRSFFRRYVLLSCISGSLITFIEILVAY